MLPKHWISLFASLKNILSDNREKNCSRNTMDTCECHVIVAETGLKVNEDKKCDLKPIWHKKSLHHYQFIMTTYLKIFHKIK